jgi:hypothetical protein
MVIQACRLRKTINYHSLDSANLASSARTSRLKMSKTEKRAHILAISHALRFARQTIKTYSGTREDVALEGVKVLPDSGDVVALVSRYRDNVLQSLDDIASPNDRKMIAKVLADIKKLEKRGIKVEITRSAVEDTFVGVWASAKAKIIAKRMGRKASRYFQECAQACVAVKELGDGMCAQMTLELPLRPKTSESLQAQLLLDPTLIS